MPRYFYGQFPELEFIELGSRAAYRYDEGSSLEHRLCEAHGLVYDCRHWVWERDRFAHVNGYSWNEWQAE